jgi:hypothetical protein
MDQEVSWGIVQSATEVRRVGDTADTAIEWKDAELDLSIGDRVVIVRASSTDSWVVACVLDEIAAPAVSPFCPTGTFIQGGWTTAPSGFLLMNGVAVVGGATLYPALAAMFPAWVSGSNLTPPNAAGANLLASTGTPGVVSGSMSLTLTEAQMPSHNHAETRHTHSWTDFPLETSPGTFQAGTNKRGRVTDPTDTGLNAASNTGLRGSGSAIDITGKNLTVRVAVKT